MVPLPAAAQAIKPAARGVYVVLPANDPNLKTEPCWKNPRVVGVLLRTQWHLLEPYKRRWDCLAAATPEDTDLEPHDILSPAATRLEALANAYRLKDLGSLFKKLKVHVPWEDYDDLKQITLAQWIPNSHKQPIAVLRAAV